jgi:hypothetical protein
MTQAQLITRATHGDSLADILERVLNTGVVIAGDIRIKLCDVELLSIQLRLLVCSVEKARELGISWWWQTAEQPASVAHQPQAPHASVQGPHVAQPPLFAQQPCRVSQGEPITEDDYRQFCEFRRFRESVRAEHMQVTEERPQ